jgi:hypothetical protein
LIATLLLDAARPKSAKSRRGATPMECSQPGHRTAEHRRPRCRCGQCRQCLDDARWERIFTEKFADPDYYTRRHVRCSSPLESL